MEELPPLELFDQFLGVEVGLRLADHHEVTEEESRGETSQCEVGGEGGRGRVVVGGVV